MGKSDFRTVCMSTLLRANRPRGQSEFIATLKTSLDEGKHPLQLKKSYRTMEEAGRCMLNHMYHKAKLDLIEKTYVSHIDSHQIIRSLHKTYNSYT